MVHAIAGRAPDAYRVVEEVHAVDPRDESGLTATAKRLRMELLRRKANWGRNSATSCSPAPLADAGYIGFPDVGPEPGTRLTRSRLRLVTTPRSLNQCGDTKLDASPEYAPIITITV
jgi:hypothetical protein